MAPKFDRKVITKKLTLEDAEKLVGSIRNDKGRALTAIEIMLDPNISKVHQVRDIDTGKLKLADEHHNNTKIPFFVIKAGG